MLPTRPVDRDLFVPWTTSGMLALCVRQGLRPCAIRMTLAWEGFIGKETPMTGRTRAWLGVCLVVLSLWVQTPASALLGPTLAGFHAVQLGMSAAEVVAILGRPTRTVTETLGGALPSAVYAWDIPRGGPWEKATIWITLERDKVTHKRHDGL